MKENQNRMLKVFLFCVLGFSIYGVSGEDNSTQMYYVVLKVDHSAIGNVSQTLLNKNYNSDDYNLYNLIKTTECRFSQSDVKSCNCAWGFKWSTDACLSKSRCCGTETCEDNKFSCLPKSSVTFTGSLTLTDVRFHNCLGDSDTNEFKECNENLTTTIKAVYSQIYGFESLKIIEYKTGSVIVKFEVVVASDMDPSVLQQTSQNLTMQLEAMLNLETKGVVRLKVPAGLVKYNTSTTVTCCADTHLGSTLHWELKNYLNETKDIHNGSECGIITRYLNSSLQLTSVSQLWKGRYTCSFKQHQNNVNIYHKASADMDVCVVPKVIITSRNPGFPRCESSTALLPVTVFCEVEQTYEDYNVTWDSEDIPTKISPQDPYNDLGMTVFSAKTFVSCAYENPSVTCNLTNRCDELKQGVINIIIIKQGDAYCEAEGEWGDTKAGEKAVIKCTGSVGNRTRPCNKDGKWGPETSFCVILELQSVLSNAEISNIGLGRLETNAENVFTRLQSVTNNTRAINSVANLETSVEVIITMGDKLTQLENETTVNDFLRSSSNLLEKSLENSWRGENRSSQSLAEKYLSSVEELIEKASIKRQTKNPNLDVVSCNNTQKPCQSTVFNNTVKMESHCAYSAKTAGFLELEHYLPNQDYSDDPNSIVISTTMQCSNSLNRVTSGVKIHINFELRRPRPRNTELKCVFWNMSLHKWSEEGCRRIGSVDKGGCECDHLSAFAILMSKAPLEVPYLSEVTYVGLGVSIVSLIMYLGIELIIWSDVVKTDTLHLRHCAHVNISVCLLVGDVCFLASQLPKQLSNIWCQTFVVVEHFCFLAMFFWMLCLSSILLHKTVYLSLHGISKTAYLRFSIIVGYICPLLIVAITFVANSGAEGRYYSKETRWLIYNGTFKGTIFTFILPIGIIVFVNVFFMALVIMRLLQPVKVTQLDDKEKNSAKTVIRSVILLTPIFGLTWGFGFVVMTVDLTQGAGAYAVNYIFTIMNAFQGLYIFLTTCMGDRMVREALRRYFQKKTSAVPTVSSNSFDADKTQQKKN